MIPSRRGTGRRSDGARRSAARSPTVSTTGRKSRPSTIHSPASRSCWPRIAFSLEADGERAGAGAADVRQAHAPGRAAMARRRSTSTPVAFAIADRSPVGLYLVGRGDALRGAGSRALPRLSCGRAGTRQRTSACPGSRCRRNTDRRHRFCGGSDSSDGHDPHAHVTGHSRMSSAPRGAPAVPGLPRFASCRRGWARRGGRSRGAQDRRRRSTSPTWSW